MGEGNGYWRERELHTSQPPRKKSGKDPGDTGTLESWLGWKITQKRRQMILKEEKQICYFEKHRSEGKPGASETGAKDSGFSGYARPLPTVDSAAWRVDRVRRGC